MKMQDMFMQSTAIPLAQMHAPMTGPCMVLPDGREYYMVKDGPGDGENDWWSLRLKGPGPNWTWVRARWNGERQA